MGREEETEIDRIRDGGDGERGREIEKETKQEKGREIVGDGKKRRERGLQKERERDRGDGERD